jgi:WD40 repeat protein
MTSEADQIDLAAPEVKAKLFISYSRKDLAFTDKLEAGLRALGFEVLVDRSEIYAFEDWWKRVETLIARADTLIFVLSPDALSSVVCRREIDFAASLNKRLAPVVCRPVDAGAVPDLLSRLQFVRFDDEASFDTTTNRLAEALSTNIEWIRKHTEFGEQSRQWKAKGAPSGLMLRSPALEDAERWIAARPGDAPEPSLATREFIRLSRQAAGRRRNRVIGSLAAGLVVALGLTVFAFGQRDAAIEQRAVADSSKRDADASAAAARSSEQRALAEADRARRNESLALADQSLRDTADGDAIAGLVKGINALPQNLDHPERAFTSEAELALLKAFTANRTEYLFQPSEDLIWGANYSPNGKLLATGTQDGLLTIWDAVTGNQVNKFDEKRGQIFSVVFSPDNTLLATAYGDESASIVVRTVANGDVLHEFKVNGRTEHIVFTSDSRRLLAITRLKSPVPRVWDLRTGAEMTAFDDPRITNHGVRAAVLSSDDKLIAISSYTVGFGFQGYLWVWNVDTGKLVLTTYDNLSTKFSDAKVNNFDFTSDESIFKLAFIGRDRIAALGGQTLYLIDTTMNMVLNNWNLFEQRTSGPLSIFIPAADLKSVILSASATDLEVRSLVDGSRIATLRGHKSQLRRGAISPDGRQFAAAADDLSIRVWSLESISDPLVLRGHTKSIEGLAYSSDSVHLMSYGDQTARIWDLRPDYRRFAAPMETLGWKFHDIDSTGLFAVLKMDRGAAAKSGEDDTAAVGIWSYFNHELLGRFDAKDGFFFDLSASGFFEASQTIGLAIHTLLANTSPERAVTSFLGTNVIPDHILRDSEVSENEEMEAFFLISASTLKISQAVLMRRPIGYDLSGVEANAEFTSIAFLWSKTVSDDQPHEIIVQVWDIDTLNKTLEISQEGYDPRLMLTDTKRVVLQTTRDGITSPRLNDYMRKVTIWDTASGRQINAYDRALSNYETNIGLAGNHDRVLLSGTNSVPTLVELSTGKQIGNIAGSTYRVRSVLLSADERHLMVGRQGLPWTLWDLQDGMLLGYLPSHDGQGGPPVGQSGRAQFSGDGLRIVTNEWNKEFDSTDTSVEIFDTVRGGRLREIKFNQREGAESLGFSGKYVAVSTGRGVIELHTVESNVKPIQINLRNRLQAWMFAADDERFLTLDDLGVLALWNVQTGEKVNEFENGSTKQSFPSSVGARRRVAFLLQSGQRVVIDVISGKMVWRSANADIDNIVVSEDGRTVVATEGDLIEVYDLDNRGVGTQVIEGGTARGIWLSEDSSRALILVSGGKSVLLDVSSAKIIGSYPNIDIFGGAQAGGSKIVLISKNVIETVNSASGAIDRSFELTSPVVYWSTNKSSDIFGFVTDDMKLHFVDILNGEQRQSSILRSKPKYFRIIGRDRYLLLEDDDLLSLRRITDGKTVTFFFTEWPTESNTWKSITDGTGAYVAVLTPDEIARVYRTKDGSQSAAWYWYKDTVSDFAFSSTGETFVVLASNGQLVFVDADSGRKEKVVELGGSFGSFESKLALAPGGFFMTVQDKDMGVYLINVESRTASKLTSNRPEKGVVAAASSDGCLVGTISEDGVLRVWLAAAAEVIFEMQTDAKQLIYKKLRFSDNNRLVIIEPLNEEPRVWEVPPMGTELVVQARQVLARLALRGQPEKRELEFGLKVSPLAASRSDQTRNGVVVTALVSGSAADDAGVRVGDVIVRFDEEDTTEPKALDGLVEKLSVYREIPIVVLRHNERKELWARFGR